MIYCDLQGLHRSKVLLKIKGYTKMSFYLSVIVPIAKVLKLGNVDN